MPKNLQCYKEMWGDVIWLEIQFEPFAVYIDNDYFDGGGSESLGRFIDEHDDSYFDSLADYKKDKAKSLTAFSEQLSK